MRAIALALWAMSLTGCWLLPSWCDDDCKASGGCGKEGLTCYPRNDDDCRRSALCRDMGACKAKDKMCVLGGTPPRFGE
jgi:hypothetical protein